MRFAHSITLAALAALAIIGCGGDEETTSSAPYGSGAESTSTDSTSTTTSTVTESTATGSTTASTTTDETGLPRERCEGAESPPNIVNVISYGADCGAVEEAMAEIRSVATEFRIGDFECARTSGGRFGGIWECRGEASYFTFDFAD